MKQVWERLRAELLHIIEWSDAIPGAPSPDGDTLAWRFSNGASSLRDSAIRHGSQLIVREGQWALPRPRRPRRPPCATAPAPAAAS